MINPFIDLDVHILLISVNLKDSPNFVEIALEENYRSNKKVLIEVTDEDIIKMKGKMISIVDSIIKGSFSPKPGREYKNCDYSLICDSAKI
jgi:hypothetical protein